jgi:hypothetical protein
MAINQAAANALYGKLSALLAARFRAYAEVRAPQVLAAVRNPLEKWAVSKAVPRAEAEIPLLVDEALKAIHDEFGKLNVADLMNFLESQIH